MVPSCLAMHCTTNALRRSNCGAAIVLPEGEDEADEAGADMPRKPLSAVSMRRDTAMTRRAAAMDVDVTEWRADDVAVSRAPPSNFGRADAAQPREQAAGGSLGLSALFRLVASRSAHTSATTVPNAANLAGCGC